MFRLKLKWYLLACWVWTMSLTLQAQQAAMLPDKKEALTQEMEQAFEQMRQARKQQRLADYKHWAEKTIVLALQLDNLAYETTARNSLAYLYKDQGNYQKALPLFKKNIRRLREKPSSSEGAKPSSKAVSLGESLNNLGIVYWRLGLHEEAKKYFLAALEVDKHQGNKRGLLRSHNHLSLISTAQNNYKIALQYGYQALDLAKELNIKKEIARVYINLGYVEQALEHYPTAIAYYQEILELSKRHSKPTTETNIVKQRYGLPAIEAQALNNLAVIYTAQQKYKQAEELLKQALETNRQLSRMDKEALNLFSLGELMQEKEDFEQAIHYLEKSLSIYKKMDIKEQVCGVFIALARVYIQLGQLDVASRLAKKGEALANAHDLKSDQINALKVLKTIYVQQKQYKQALAAQKEIIKLKEALLDEQKVKEIETLRIAHEAEQKEQAIVLLEKEKSLQALQVAEQTNLAKYNQARLALLFKEKLLQTRTFAQTRKENEQVLARTVYEKKQEAQRYQAEQQRKQLLEKESQLKATALTTSKLRRRNFILIGGAVILLILIVGGWLLKNQQQRIQLAKEKAQRQQLVAQFDRLKNQVQPHFLFNSLQALASLIPQDAQKAHQFTTAFSQLYQSVLTLNNDILTSLKEEVGFCKTYLTVQQIRFEEYLQVNWQLSADALEAQIPPLALQLTLENAIKHNEISAAHPLKVDVYEEAGKVVVKNSLKVTDRNVASTHIGVKNIMERYELLSTATPTFVQTDQHYITKLPLV